MYSFTRVCRGVTGIFFWGGKVTFPDFFPVVFQKWKAKEKKSPHLFFITIYHLPSFSFSIFIPFPFSLRFPCFFFRSEVSGGTLPPLASSPPPPPVTPLRLWCLFQKWKHFQHLLPHAWAMHSQCELEIRIVLHGSLGVSTPDLVNWINGW